MNDATDREKRTALVVRSPPKDIDQPRSPLSAFDVFYATIGRVMGAWAQVESALAVLFESAVKTERAEQAAAIFCSGLPFSERLTITEAALRSQLIESETWYAWTRLKEALQREFVKRNAVAHGVPVVVTTKGNERLVLTASKHWLATEARRHLLKGADDTIDATFETVPPAKEVFVQAAQPDDELDLGNMSRYVKDFNKVEETILRLAQQIVTTRARY